MESPLLKAQLRFALKISNLIILANGMGYAVKFGMAYRPKEMAEIYAKLKRGVANSIHEWALGIDLLLFKDGVYLTKMEDYLPLGESWERMTEPECPTFWGGRIVNPRCDPNHFSVRWDGRA